ncbi:MAG: HpcH/HpaI aldolase/citrate lyase family protein [Bacteroidales bacterium]|nr:HpcH/HpaI aldolase/citrate lyase family protein [Bacteroidales bacterium]
MPVVAEAGNKGEKIRSDCFIQFNLLKSGGLKIELTSKVKSLFGNDIIRQIKDICSFFDVRHAQVQLEDSGALPFVIEARMEAAIKQVVRSDKSLLMPMIQQNEYKSSRDRFRFTRLYLPGNTPSMMLNAGIHHPNGIILDLEDSVAPHKKEEARLLVRNALLQVDFYGAERMVRINQLPMGLDDLPFVVPFNAHVILIPKCENAQTVKSVEKKATEILHETGQENTLFYMPIIENALGVEHAYEIATASGNIVAMAIGLEDYTADLGVGRSEGGEESFYARTRMVNACKAANIQPIDSVYSDVDNMDALQKQVIKSKSLGFEGMGCIHPRQIPVIHDGFRPGQEEIERARKIIEAYEEAVSKGSGVVSLGSKMIDPPVVKRAQKTIRLIEALGNTDGRIKENRFDSL